jgi:hypothetical protein
MQTFRAAAAAGASVAGAVTFTLLMGALVAGNWEVAGVLLAVTAAEGSCSYLWLRSWTAHSPGHGGR